MQTGFLDEAGPGHPVRLALARHRFAACGLDRLSPAQQGRSKQVRLLGSGSTPALTKGWSRPIAHDRLHVTNLEIIMTLGIEAQALPREGAGTSRAAARAGSAPHPDLGAGRTRAVVPVGGAPAVAGRRRERPRARGSGVHRRGVGLGR